jgi:hypothetical protein
MNLHEWITAKVEATEEAATQTTDRSWWVEEEPKLAWGVNTDEVIACSQGKIATLPHDHGGYLNALHVVLHDPEAALRRCEADRRVLARHCQDMRPINWSDSAACSGCGTYGDQDMTVTDNINECPELLDLAHAHGITAEELAALDPPETTPRPPVPPGGQRWMDRYRALLDDGGRPPLPRMAAEEAPATFQRRPQ